MERSEFVFSDCRRFLASPSVTKQLLIKHCSFVVTIVQASVLSDLKAVMNDVPDVYVLYAAGGASFLAELEWTSQGENTLPPVVPHQLATISHSQFYAIVAAHHEHFAASGQTYTRIAAMYRPHEDLVLTVTNDATLRSTVRTC